MFIHRIVLQCISRWRCMVLQRLAEHVSITATWLHHSISSLIYPICPILINPLLLKSNHSATTTLHTSYFPDRKTLLTKADNYSRFKLRQYWKWNFIYDAVSHRRHTLNFTYNLPAENKLWQFSSSLYSPPFIWFKQQSRGRCSAHSFVITLELQSIC